MRSMSAFLLFGLVVAATATGLAAGQASAGDMPSALAAGYGNGVHAFNEGDYQCSYDELTRVIEAERSPAQRKSQSTSCPPARTASMAAGFLASSLGSHSTARIRK